MTATLPSDEALRDAVTAVLPSVRADLERLVRIPSVSADDFDREQVQRSAQLTAKLLRAAGLGDVQILTSDGGRPAVLGRTAAPAGQPTVLLYAHHDVQPPGDPTAWTSEPFEPTERDGRLYARGAADDKAGIAAHLAALRAYVPLGGPPVGVTVLVEGEEEIGSPTLAAFLAEHRDLLAADVLVLADSSNWAVGRPALTTTLRGNVIVDVEVRTLEHALHSGMYGGAAPDALTALCRLVATLHDDQGDVAVAGLVTGPSDPLDLTEEQFRSDAGIADGVGLIGTGPLTSRLWSRPSLTVTGIDAPPVARASNTLLPVARAKLSMRIAPGQDGPAALEALQAHLRDRAPWGAQVRVLHSEVSPPFAAEARSPAHDAARQALAAAWGVAPVDVGVGGSIPFISAFAELFPAAALLVTGVEDPDSRAHGADESLHLGEFARVCLAEALLLRNLAR